MLQNKHFNIFLKFQHPFVYLYRPGDNFDSPYIRIYFRWRCLIFHAILPNHVYRVRSLQKLPVQIVAGSHTLCWNGMDLSDSRHSEPQTIGQLHLRRDQQILDIQHALVQVHIELAYLVSLWFKLVQNLPPILTEMLNIAGPKFLPVIVRFVPPSKLPFFGET